MRSFGYIRGEHNFGVEIIGIYQIEEIFIFISLFDL